MALFSFSDITFLNKPRVISSANQLTENSDYQSNIYRYPIDLGETDKGHYMVIHVNEQLATSFKGRPGSNEPTIFENRRNGSSLSPFAVVPKVGDVIKETVSKAVKTLVSEEAGKTTETEISGLLGSLNNDNLNIGFTRTIRRTTDTIALYMPDTLAYRNAQSYSDLQLSGFLMAAGSSISSLRDVYANQSSSNVKDFLGSLSPFLARALQGFDLGRAVFAGAAQKVVNPMLDLIYTSPAFREFQFDFMFYPRSEKEAEEVQKIINRLYFHQAPEIDTQSSGFFLVPPSEFDIKFYYNGKENLNIPKISTCVLTSMDIDYAPNGFSAYEVPGETTPQVGRTGMPVAIRLTLNFKETEVVTKSLLENNKDYYTSRQSELNNQASQTGEYGTS
jgi:hypothetical protein